MMWPSGNKTWCQMDPAPILARLSPRSSYLPLLNLTKPPEIESHPWELHNKRRYTNFEGSSPSPNRRWTNIALPFHLPSLQQRIGPGRRWTKSGSELAEIVQILKVPTRSGLVWQEVGIIVQRQKWYFRRTRLMVCPEWTTEAGDGEWCSGKLTVVHIPAFTAHLTISALVIWLYSQTNSRTSPCSNPCIWGLTSRQDQPMGG